MGSRSSRLRWPGWSGSVVVVVVVVVVEVVVVVVISSLGRVVFIVGVNQAVIVVGYIQRLVRVLTLNIQRRGGRIRVLPLIVGSLVRVVEAGLDRDRRIIARRARTDQAVRREGAAHDQQEACCRYADCPGHAQSKSFRHQGGAPAPWPVGNRSLVMSESGPGEKVSACRQASNSWPADRQSAATSSASVEIAASRSTVTGPSPALSSAGRNASASPTRTIAASSGRTWAWAAARTSSAATASIDGRYPPSSSSGRS